MRKSAFAIATILSYGLLLIARAPTQGQATRADQATDRAAAFANALGLPWGDSTEATLRENVNIAREDEWQIAFGRFARIGVDPRTGIVTSAVDHSERAVHNQAQAAPSLSEAQAVARAAEITRLAGISDAVSLGPPTVLLEHTAPGTSEYRVLFDRQYQGIPFEPAAVDICLAAEDGKLIWLSTGLDVPVPASTKVVINEEAAKDAALGFAAKVSPSQQATVASAVLKIVVPDSYWVHQGIGATEDDTVSRSAWVVTVNAGEVWYVFWIDAEDGRVLGGKQSAGTLRLPNAVAAAATCLSTRGDSGGPLRMWGTVLIGGSVVFAAAALLVARRSARRRAT